MFLHYDEDNSFDEEERYYVRLEKCSICDERNFCGACVEYCEECNQVICRGCSHASCAKCGLPICHNCDDGGAYCSKHRHLEEAGD